MLRRPDRLRRVWRAITLRRHRSELFALRLARRLGPLAMLPISGLVIVWWFAACFPILLILTLAAIVGVNPFDTGPEATLLQLIAALLLWLVLGFCGLILTVLAAPWFFHWYFIGVALTFGRTAMADRKEASLIATLPEDGCT